VKEKIHNNSASIVTPTMHKRTFNAVDLFAGCGGISEGLKDAGFKIIFANEIHPDAALTYNQNINRRQKQKTIMKVCNIKNLTDDLILNSIGNNRIHLVAAGPPCQGFSMAGKRNINDPRNFLFKHMVHFVQLLKPDFFLMENVKGLLTLNNGKAIEAIENEFRNIDYFLKKSVYNATNFGVPQRRERVIIIGSYHEDLDLLPEEKKLTPITVKEAISDLDFLGSGESSSKYQIKPSSEYQKKMRANSTALYNHEAPNHTKVIVKRFSKLEQGMRVNDLPTGEKTKKIVQFRLIENLPSPTLTTLPDDYIHYKQNRILTVRECARIQSFPDDFIFFGKKSTGGLRRRHDVPQYTQVGNAVPPLMAKGIGEHIRSLLEQIISKGD